MVGARRIRPRLKCFPVSAFADLPDVAPQGIWDGVAVRAVYGDRITLGVVELEAGSTVPEHRHDNEQLGIVLRGSVRFRVGDETRELGPGGIWRIPSNAPHEVTVGPDGAVVLDVFAPGREDWAALEPQAPRAPLWPDA
jgi:quercetin dioxygenase-like cupin family protein